MPLESRFQKEHQDEILARFPGALILKLDTAYTQGVPDRIVLHETCWATLEYKRSTHARRQPNQPYYVDLMNRMSFSRFVSPENAEATLNELERALRP
jgi:hypothetical protein